jgi:hypothetical protein
MQIEPKVWNRAAGLAACLLALAGCDGATGAPEQAADEPAASPRAEAADRAGALRATPFDVADAIERARAAFFEHDGLYVAGLETHRVDVAPGGDALAVTPIHEQGRERTLAGVRQARPSLAPTRPPRAERLTAETAFVARTASVTRGGERLDREPAAPRPRDGALFIDRGALEEEIRNHTDGVEQSWHFAERPAGEGDLEVRVAVDGMAHRGTTEHGEHFVDPATDLGVRYGHGTFVDARGARTHVPVRYDGAELVLTVPAEVIDRAAYPAVLDPIIGPEIEMDTPVVGPRSGNQFQPALAKDGTSYLVVFLDDLFGTNDLRAARVDTSGSLVDPVAFDVAASGDFEEQNADVVFNGSRYIVVYEQLTVDATGSVVDRAVFSTTISTTGAVATPAALPGDAASVEYAPSIAASGGSTSLVTFNQGTGTELDIVGVRLDGSGAALETTPFVIDGNAGPQAFPVAHGATSSFLVAYEDFTGTEPVILGVRVEATGTLVDTTPFTVASGGRLEDVGWAGGSDFAVVWNGDGGTAAGQVAVFGGLVPVSGTFTGPATAQELTPAAAGRDYAGARIVWNGTSNYLLAYVDGVLDTEGRWTEGSVTGLLLGSDLAAADSPFALSGATFTLQPAVASLGSDFLVAFTDLDDASAEVRGTGSPRPARPLRRMCC